MYWILGRRVSRFSRQGTNRRKGRFCKSFQSGKVGFNFSRYLLQWYLGILDKSHVISFNILTSLLFLGMFFMLRIRTAKHSLVLSYLHSKEYTTIFIFQVKERRKS